MSNTCLYSISKPKIKKIRRKRATVAPYSRRTRRRSKGEGGGVERWGPLRSPWGLPVVNPLGTCDNEKTGAIAIEET